jgi:hypothetical protein
MDESIEVIRSMGFMHVSRDEIHKALQDNNGSLDAAIDVILALSQTSKCPDDDTARNIASAVQFDVYSGGVRGSAGSHESTEGVGFSGGDLHLNHDGEVGQLVRGGGVGHVSRESDVIFSHLAETLPPGGGEGSCDAGREEKDEKDEEDEEEMAKMLNLLLANDAGQSGGLCTVRSAGNEFEGAHAHTHTHTQHVSLGWEGGSGAQRHGAWEGGAMDAGKWGEREEKSHSLSPLAPPWEEAGADELLGAVNNCMKWDDDGFETVSKCKNSGGRRGGRRGGGHVGSGRVGGSVGGNGGDGEVVATTYQAKHTLYDEHTSIRMVVLVGIPGSGKSWIANLFRKEGWIVVSQDELGDRRKCEAAARQASPPTHKQTHTHTFTLNLTLMLSFTHTLTHTHTHSPSHSPLPSCSASPFVPLVLLFFRGRRVLCYSAL